MSTAEAEGVKVWIDCSKMEVILTGEMLSALSERQYSSCGDCHSAEAMKLAIAVTGLKWRVWACCSGVVSVAWLPSLR